MGVRRLRARLDHLESDACDTMSDAQKLLAAAKALVEEVEDGFDLKIEKIPGASLPDFLSGKSEVFPFKVRIEFQEEKEDKDA